jgi:hypothetical protein
MTSSLQPRSASLVFFTSIGVFGLIVSAVLLLAACSITRKQNARVEPVATDPGGSTSANAQVVENRSTRSSQDRASEFQQAARVEVKERVVVGSTGDELLADGVRKHSMTAFSAGALEAIGAADVSAFQRYSGRAPSHKSFYSRSMMRTASPEWNTERYDSLSIRGFSRPIDTPLSTFSIDVDTASYSNVRRFLRDRVRPPQGAVRIEEMVNYFRYSPSDERSEEPFSVETEIFVAPWAPENRLVRIGISGHDVAQEDVPPRNLVFLIDVSGSMQGPDRLELVKYGLSELVQHLRSIDRVSIVVYAGASGLVLPPTPGDDRGRILDALSRLSAGGSTRGAAGIRLAYEVAAESFDPQGINRVILATDGDFNVGVTDRKSVV